MQRKTWLVGTAATLVVGVAMITAYVQRSPRSPFDGAAGVASLNGMMLDKPHLKLAEKVLARAKVATTN